MGAMGTKTHDVLQVPLIIRNRIGFIAVVLQAQTAVFTVGIIKHGTDAFWSMALGVQRSAAKGAARILDTQAVIAQAGTPAWQELVNQLGIPAIPVAIHRMLWCGHGASREPGRRNHGVQNRRRYLIGQIILNLIGVAAIILGSILTVLWVRVRYGRVGIWERLATPDLRYRRKEETSDERQTTSTAERLAA